MAVLPLDPLPVEPPAGVPGSAADRVRAAYARDRATDRPEIWISLRPEPDALDDAKLIDARVADGEVLPLAGLVVAVKDNVDVAGLPTTAACPGYARRPAADAPAVARLVDAGAVVLGKTNLDQFATGLVGTRSPYGAVRDARRPEYVSGGSSSGSAVAVALGIADIGVATDTAGSGRVPAAFAGIVGVKPTRGLIPVTGVVPAAPSWDCVSVFGGDLPLAALAARVMAGAGPAGPQWPADAPLGAPPRPRLAVPRRADLTDLTPAARDAFERAVARVAADVVEIDLGPFLAAGRLLYEGAFVAERYAAVGSFLETQPPTGLDPTVRQIVTAAKNIPAHQLAEDRRTLARLQATAMAALAGCDVLVVPTTTAQPTLAEVAADPIGSNSRLGVYTTFANLFDLCAVAIPGGEADGGCFGLTVLARPFHDAVATDVAALLLGLPRDPAPLGPAPTGTPLLVVGAHLHGLALNRQLTDRGARFLRAVRTAPEYRLHRLPGEPARPGMVRVAEGGVSVAGELWSLPPAGLGAFLTDVPAPLSLGRVRLEDGTSELGFLAEASACAGALDISRIGGWRAYLAAQPPG